MLGMYVLGANAIHGLIDGYQSASGVLLMDVRVQSRQAGVYLSQPRREVVVATPVTEPER